MRFSIRVFLLVPILSVFIACTSKPTNSDQDQSNSSVANEINDFGENQLDSDNSQGQATNNVQETNKESTALDSDDTEIENELSADDSSQNAPTQNQNENANSAGTNSQQAAQQTPPPPAAAPENPVPENPAPEASAPEAAPQVRITDLQYVAKKDGGTIQVTTSGPAQYQTRRNDANNQFVIEIQNATLPDRLKRPFITNEFKGEVASINAYQDPGSATARIVIQLKDNVEPQVEQQGNAILIKPNMGGAVAKDDTSSESATDADSDTSADDTQQPAVDQNALNAEKGKVTTFQDFLLGQTKFYGRKINIEAEDEDVRNVFDLIAKESGANIVLDDKVTGKITVRLRDVPWDQAMVVVMKSMGLGFIREGNVLRVASLETLKKESDMARDIVDAKLKADPLRVKVVPISYASVDEIAKHLEKFLTPRGKVAGDNASSSVVITDTPDNLDRLIRLVQALDIPPEEVLIEGKIVEAQESLNNQIGVNWTMGGTPTQINTNNTGGPVNLTPSFTYGPSLPLQGAGAGVFGVSVNTLDYVGNLTAALALFQEEDLAKIVSSPRIATMNRVEATITQQFDQPITVTTVTNGISQTETTYRPAQLLLKVTPQITSDGSVIMDMDVKRQYFGQQTQEGRPENTREAKTKILVKSGQTAVIGGIYDNQDVTSNTGIPGLSKIPIIGWLFHSRQRNKDRNELLIFLTPRILSQADLPANEVTK